MVALGGRAVAYERGTHVISTPQFEAGDGHVVVLDPPYILM